MKLLVARQVRRFIARPGMSAPAPVEIVRSYGESSNYFGLTQPVINGCRVPCRKITGRSILTPLVNSVYI